MRCIRLGFFVAHKRVLSKDLVHSHVSNNADDGLNGMDFGQAECDSYFMTGAVVGVGFAGVRSLKGAQVFLSSPKCSGVFLVQVFLMKKYIYKYRERERET